MRRGGKGPLIQTDKSGTLACGNDQVLFQPIMPRERERVVALDRASYNQGKNAKFGFGIGEDGVAWTLTAKGPGAVAYASAPTRSERSTP